MLMAEGQKIFCPYLTDTYSGRAKDVSPLHALPRMQRDKDGYKYLGR
jgi:hypothetical protein